MNSKDLDPCSLFWGQGKRDSGTRNLHFPAWLFLLGFGDVSWPVPTLGWFLFWSWFQTSCDIELQGRK